ncbi:calcium-binding protein [Jannaschia sp. M317]|uniref:calcium-binding protein n=1 Tax=Jannaschia sp. M317 TaxID=2867011 RepID=UPI0021A2FFC6|nr:calcium-binding protein [Jannaschia sp. M317]UWQ19655.1 hypothetical protein K3551_18030 [Jannaschia sp. M317]
MAHVFDYSASPHNVEAPFGLYLRLDDFALFSGGVLVSQAFGARGYVSDTVTVSTQYHNGQDTTATATVGVDADGTVEEMGARPLFPSAFGSDILAHGAPGFATALGQFGYAGFNDHNVTGRYVTVNGVAAPTPSLNLPDTAVPLARLPAAIDAAVADTRENLRDDIEAILDTRLDEISSISSVYWRSAETRVNPDQVLTYRPDAATDLRLGDLIDPGGAETSDWDPFTTAHTPLVSAFEGEDVTFLLTHTDDHVFAREFASDSFVLQAGSGNDYVALELQALATPSVRFNSARSIDIHGDAGDDRIELTTNLGDTVALQGGAGNDIMTLAFDTFVVTGDANVSLLDGGDGDDVLNGSFLYDILLGGEGNDTLVSGGPTEELSPGWQRNYYGDRLDGGAGNDRLFGGLGRDILVGGEGHDYMYGGGYETGSGDRLFGGAGDDTLSGGGGNDELRGDAGGDITDGVRRGYGHRRGGQRQADRWGPGRRDLRQRRMDFINGGFGSEGQRRRGCRCLLPSGHRDHGSDWIQDYSAADGDVLVFGQAGATRDQFQVNRAHTLDAGAGRHRRGLCDLSPHGTDPLGLGGRRRAGRNQPAPERTDLRSERLKAGLRRSGGDARRSFPLG